MSKKSQIDAVQYTIETVMEDERGREELLRVLRSIRDRVANNISHQFWYHHIDQYEGLRDCNGQLINSQPLDKP